VSAKRCRILTKVGAKRCRIYEKVGAKRYKIIKKAFILKEKCAILIVVMIIYEKKNI
jgi:hypothetical protein